MAPARPGTRSNSECVKVVVRCRPLSSKEISDGRQRIVDMDVKVGQIMVKNPKMDIKEPAKVFTFDRVYDWNSTQSQIYEDAARPIVDSVIEGYNGTIFAYGQTGTGKTHTMEGKDDPADLKGIIPNAFEHVFREIDQSDNTEFLVRASFLEIYNEEIRDLLAKNPSNKLELKENVDSGVYVRDLTSFVVKGVAEIRNVLQVGKKNRSVGATLMNQDSSRSHSIFTITIETSSRNSGGADGPHIRVGKLNLVDLAGSERQSKTGATGDRFKELTNINWSLSALGNVISALVDGKSGHIPYRDSKLTRLLQDSLGGNTRTVMVANLGPADYNFDETISTLRYANRAKNIKNKPRINEDPKDAMLREFQEEIARLRAQLQQSMEAGGPNSEVRTPEATSPKGAEEARAKEEVLSDERVKQLKEQMRKEMEESLRKSMSEEALENVKAEMQRKAKEEMDKMLAEKERSEDEKRCIAKELTKQHEELQRHYEALAKEKEERDTLSAKLQAMEEKLLHGTMSAGGESLVDKTQRQELELAQRQAELDEKKRLDEERQRKIAELEEAQLMAEEKYSSFQEELEMKTKKLKKLMGKFQSAKAEVEAARAEMADLHDEFQREREDYLDSIRHLSQQLKLKSLIIQSFIPTEEESKIVRRAHWDGEREEWELEHINCPSHNPGALRPLSAAGLRRPVSAYSRFASAMGDQNPRYRAENILMMELEMPERTTYDYEGAVGNPRVQAALDQTLAEVDDSMSFASIDSMPSVYFSYNDTEGGDRRPSRMESAGKRPKSARRKDSRPRTAVR